MIIIARITIIDSIMGSGKSTWAKSEIINNRDKNYLYITPYLKGIDLLQEYMQMMNVEMLTPKNQGCGKLSNISDLFKAECNIASTHALFRKFDDACKDALRNKRYCLILDETITAVEPYTFEHKDDFKMLLNQDQVTVNADGVVEWTGDDQLDTRFNDVKILAQNKCLFQIDNKFFLWQFPRDIFDIFDKIYVLTYRFNGSLMKYYFDLYKINYEIKGLRRDGNTSVICEPYEPDKTRYKERIRIYKGKLNDNICAKPTMLSATWSRSQYWQRKK